MLSQLGARYGVIPGSLTVATQEAADASIPSDERPAEEALNRTGFGGDSGYWIPTSCSLVRWAA